MNSQLVEILLNGGILHIPAMAFDRAGFYGAMALITTIGDINIGGEAFDLPDGEEVFFLNVDEFEADNWWHDEQGRPAWPPPKTDDGGWNAVDLLPGLTQLGLGAAFEEARLVTFYRSARDARAGLPAKGVLHSAAAIRFSGSNSLKCQILVYATPEFPCSLEVVWEKERIQSIITELEEFRLT